MLARNPKKRAVEQNWEMGFDVVKRRQKTEFMLQIYVFGFIKPPPRHQHSCAVRLRLFLLRKNNKRKHFSGLSGFSVHLLLLPLLSISSEMKICAREQSIWVIALSCSLLSFFTSTEHKSEAQRKNREMLKTSFIFTFLSRRSISSSMRAEVFINAAFLFMHSDDFSLFSSFLAVVQWWKERVEHFSPQPIVVARRERGLHCVKSL